MTKEEFQTYTLDLKSDGFNVFSSDPKSDFSFSIEKPSIRKTNTEGDFIYARRINISLNDYEKMFDMLEEVVDRVSDSYSFDGMVIYFAAHIPDYSSKTILNPKEIKEKILKYFDGQYLMVSEDSHGIFRSLNFYFKRKIKKFEDI